MAARLKPICRNSRRWNAKLSASSRCSIQLRRSFLSSVRRSRAYLDDDGVQCVVTLVYMNNFRLLGKSIKKRYSAEVRRAWYALNTDCGKPLDRYHIHQVRSYHLPHQRFEFVEGSKVLPHLEDHSATYERVADESLRGSGQNAQRFECAR